MSSLRNPLLFALCLLLLANLLFNSPGRSSAPHARREAFRSSAAPRARASSSPVGDGGERGSDAAFGQMVYASNCTACHGSRGHGVPRQGANLRESKFVAAQSDDELVRFLKQGRAPADAGSVMSMLMPPRGGNRSLEDAALVDVVAFLRELQEDARQEQAGGAAAAADVRNTQ